MAIEHFQKYIYSTPQVNSPLSRVIAEGNFGAIPHRRFLLFRFPCVDCRPAHRRGCKAACDAVRKLMSIEPTRRSLPGAATIAAATLLLPAVTIPAAVPMVVAAIHDGARP